jgi:CRP-like cAMP-binding protein
MADREVGDALAASFLAEPPAEVVSELVANAARADYPAGTTIYLPGSKPQTALVIRGLLRNLLPSPQGRQLTYRYTTPGDMLDIAVLAAGPVNVGVQAVKPSSLFRISAGTLTAAARNDPRVSPAIAESVTRRLCWSLLTSRQ